MCMPEGTLAFNAGEEASHTLTDTGFAQGKDGSLSVEGL